MKGAKLIERIEELAVALANETRRAGEMLPNLNAAKAEAVAGIRKAERLVLECATLEQSVRLLKADRLELLALYDAVKAVSEARLAGRHTEAKKAQQALTGIMGRLAVKLEIPF